MKVGYDATFQKMIGCSHVDLQKAGRREAINNLGSGDMILHTSGTGTQQHWFLSRPLLRSKIVWQKHRKI